MLVRVPNPLPQDLPKSDGEPVYNNACAGKYLIIKKKSNTPLIQGINDLQTEVKLSWYIVLNDY